MLNIAHFVYVVAHIIQDTLYACLVRTVRKLITLLSHSITNLSRCNNQSCRWFKNLNLFYQKTVSICIKKESEKVWYSFVYLQFTYRKSHSVNVITYINNIFAYVNHNVLVLKFVTLITQQLWHIPLLLHKHCKFLSLWNSALVNGHYVCT